MGHVVSNQPWGVLDIDTNEGRVFFQQDWFYTCQMLAGTSAWTYPQKHHFHTTLDKQIWGRWSMRVRLHVIGNSPFAKSFMARGVPINFDVRWALKPGHWSGNAFKVPAGSSVNVYRSNVIFGARVINLYSIALTPYTAGNAALKSNPGFLTVPHEFGHAIGAPDEYNADSANLGDTSSIMNIGKSLRDRHLNLIITTLNGMIPGTTFKF